MKQLNHTEIEELLFFTDPVSGNVIATKKDDAINYEGKFLAFGPRVTLAPELYNLITAAPMMYQTLTQTHVLIERLSNAAEEMPQTPEIKDLQGLFAAIQNSILLAHSVAQKGIEQVAKSLDTPK